MLQANNVITIIGRAGADPEMKYIDANKVVTKFNVAVNRTQKDSNGNNITDWFSCEFWGKQAEFAGEFIKKGTLVSVVGSARIDKWKDKESGENRSRFFVLGDSFQLLSSKNEMGGSDSSEGSAPAKAKSSSDDDFMDLEDDIPPF